MLFVSTCYLVSAVGLDCCIVSTCYIVSTY
nr:MAG TPA: hypothetical protein [Caudoviricetes sp.]